MSEWPYESTHLAAKAAITIALAHANREIADEDYQRDMGEILKHHPTSLLYVAHYAAIALETAAAVKGKQTAQELWAEIAPQLLYEEGDGDYDDL